MPTWNAAMAAESEAEKAAKAIETRDLMRQLDTDEVPPLPHCECPDGLYRADSGEIVRIHHGRPEPAF